MVKNGHFGVCREADRGICSCDTAVSLKIWVFQKFAADRGIAFIGYRGLVADRGIGNVRYRGLCQVLPVCGVFEGFWYPEARG